MSTDESLSPADAQFGDFFELLKPRVMSLVIFTAFVGMIAAPSPPHPVVGFAALLCIAVGAGASGALNMWWDADIDAVMRRTSKRPVPDGRLDPDDALAVGLGLSGLSVLMLFLFGSPLAAGLLAFTIFFYAVVYTIWLKRSTPQNIVIGGAAGAFPPMIGWAVSTGGISIDSVLMFLLIFMWTPPHFWALALFMNEDYSRAGVPMLTVTHGRRFTRRNIFAYTLLVIPVALALIAAPAAGVVYAGTAVVLNLLFFLGALRLLRRDEVSAEADGYRAEKRFFGFSILYLFLHFGALAIDALLRTLT